MPSPGDSQRTPPAGGGRDARQRAVDQAITASRSVATTDRHSESTLTAVVAARMVAADILVFAGVDPRQVPHSPEAR